MLNIIERGGDVDTNCSIAGALLGAYFGMDNIPQQWIDTIYNFDNPRKNAYPEADQLKLKTLIEGFCTVDKKK